jgi:hypothetical protein
MFVGSVSFSLTGSVLLHLYMIYGNGIPFRHVSTSV